MAAIIIKIGGSAFSDKRTGKSFVNVVARNVAKELPKKEKVLIIQGAGHIGHSIAKKYNLSKLSNNQNGWALLRYNVEQVTNVISKAMIDKGYAPMALSASSFFKIESGQAIVKNLDILRDYLNMGFIPLMHSDAPIDSINGLSILSGDDMAVLLANRLGASKLIFGTDVDGIYDKDKRTISSILKKDLKKLSISDADTGGTIDVTGGMAGKLKQIRMAKKGVKVYIINLRKHGELKKAASGKKTGTCIS
ncbi:MAG: isopentenyl phosphate kinase [Candidatus Marsarchaeota archaeon]|nr:isopentenyl phosphate kinase [Candidatus Marsarchaeota archaeon]